MKLRLAHKVLIVIALPVVFQLAFLAVMMGFLGELDRNQEFAQKANESLILRDRIYTNFYQRFLLFGIYQTNRDDRYLDEMDKVDADMKVDFIKAAKLWKDDPTVSRGLNEIWRTNKLFALMCRLGTNLLFSDQISSMLGSSERMAFLRQALDNEQDATIEVAFRGMRDDQIVAERKLLERTKELNILLIAGAIASVLISLGCGVFFSLNVTERLKRVLMNIKAMERREPILETPQKSTDEIGQLDRAVAATARQIREAEEFQAQTTQLVAHELQNPLHKIAEGFGFIRESGFEQLNEKGADRMHHVSSELQRLRSLVDELVVLDNMRDAGFNLKIDRMDLAEVANEACLVVAEFADKQGVRLVNKTVSATVAGDRERVLQIVVNLLSNAIKFSPQGSDVEISLEGKSDRVRFIVTDYGRGIPAEFQSKIFSRFEQAQATDAGEKKGSGLGLVICKKLIEAQSGAMGFTSQEGLGSIFWFELPTKSAQLPSAIEKAVPSESAKWSPSLKRQMLALVALPLIVQLVTMFLLWQAMNSAKDNLVELARSREVASTHTYILKSLVRSTVFAMMYNATQKPDVLADTKEEWQKLDGYLSALKTLSGHNKELLESADTVGAMVHKIEQLQTELVEAEQDTTVLRWFGRDRARESSTLLTQTQAPFNDALAYQQRMLDQRALSRLETRRELQMILLYSAIISAIVSIGLAIFFVRKVTSRVNRIVSNTVHLQKHEALADPVPGTDELAFVDKAFYDAGNKLMELERFKQEMISVTSHELRTPLTSLLALADLIAAGVFGTLTERGTEALIGARREAARLIAMITNLLDSEKMQSGKILVAPKKVPVNSIVSEATSEAMELVGNDKVSVEPHDASLTVNADSARVVQALVAILQDVAERTPDDSTIKVKSSATNGGVALQVLVPSPAPSAEDARSRLSLGLSRLIAQQHGGRFEVEEKTDQQTYTFVLPN